MSERSKSENHVRVEIEGDLLGLSALSLQDRLPLADLSQNFGLTLRPEENGITVVLRLGFGHLPCTIGTLTQ